MKFKLFLLVFVAVLIGIFWYVTVGHYSSGSRAGTVSKLSERGYVFKTYEGVLNEGGFSGETGSLQARYWDFSAKEEEVVEKLQRAMASGERVTLKYNEKFFQFPWNGDTKYFVTDVLFLEKPAQKPTSFPTQPQVETPVGPQPDTTSY
ncbi:MAG: hypothetical protein ACK4UP_03840 [Spirosomataceae bacterium]